MFGACSADSLVPRLLLLSLNCLYLVFVTVLVSESVTEPETSTMTGADTVIVTGAETVIVTEYATVPETVLVTEPVTVFVFVVVIETGSLAPGLRFENPVVQFQEPPVWTLRILTCFQYNKDTQVKHI
ncbi:hypothetical protein Tco_0476048 [Tanacetum coccineum]